MVHPRRSLATDRSSPIGQLSGTAHALTRFLACCVGFGIVLGASEIRAARPIVLELVSVGGSIEGPQEWVRALQQIPAVESVRIRSDRNGVEPAWVNRDAPDDPAIRLVGILTADDLLVLPNATFRRNEIGRLTKWFAQLEPGDEDSSNDPEETTSAKKGSPDQVTANGPFGLSDQELSDTLGFVAQTVDFPTRDRPRAEVVRRLLQVLSGDVEMSSAAQQALAEAPPVAEELQGLSLGTSLALVLRPAGCGWTPQASPPRFRAQIDRTAKLAEAWPIGWPLEKPERTAVPKLGESIEVQIRETPLSQALEALGGRLALPFMFDHNGLAAAEIDITTARVDFPARRATYRRILDRLLFQARLKGVMRADEGQRPFLWIEPLQP